MSNGEGVELLKSEAVFKPFILIEETESKY